MSAAKSARRWLYITGVFVLCAWVVVPIYLVALGGFGGRMGVFRWPKEFLPINSSMQAMLTFIQIEGVAKAAMNSVIAASLCMIFAVALGAPAGYALSRFAFRGAHAYRLLVLLTRAFPLAILALPLTVTFIRLGLYDTPLGVALIHTALALPFAVLVSSSLFMGIPREYEEAAWVFGCSGIGAFLRVVLPLALPGLAATCITADALDWQPDQPFDAILLDAPCSATGTIRRHPDLPFVKDGSEIAGLVALQTTLLDRALGWLKPGGRLVFVTCSLLPDEGESQLTAALARHPGLSVLRPTLPGLSPDWITPDGREALEKYGIAAPLTPEADKEALLSNKRIVKCPQCKSTNTRLISQFGSTACKALFQCEDCLEPFDYFKCLK
jgi:multiple sugar transport system permease protein